MIHALIIALVAFVIARDGVPDLPLLREIDPRAVWIGSLLPMAALVLLLQIMLRWCSRGLERTGRWMYIRIAEGVLSSSRWCAVMFQGVNIILLGWLDAVREALGGNLILIDEAIATLPPLLVFILGWAFFYPIDRQLREASIIRTLDTTGAVPDMPTRWGYTLDQVRHHLLIVLVPISLILGWSELVDVILHANEGRLESLDPRWLGIIATTLHMAGVIGVLVLVPLVIRIIWRTVPLGPGELRDRLVAMCRAQKVRCRDLLVWRTHSNMLNGAVIGVVPSLRYILLTDALLEQLPAKQVEAVMAHELAHARRHHLPWLMLGMVAAISLSWLAAATAIDFVLHRRGESAEHPSALTSVVGFTAAVAAGFIVFGWISRRFEEQADAFAAQHLSGMTRASERDDDTPIEPEAAACMAMALDAVAQLNHIPRERFSWRHGSIAARQARLARLIGQPINALPIDRVFRIIRAAILLTIAGLIGLWVLAA